MSLQTMPCRRMALRVGLCFLVLPLLLGLAGCGTQAQNALKVQETLSEALRLAQVKTTDTEARQWADRAIAVAPQNPATYFGPRPSTSDTLLPQLSVAAVFAAVGDNPALADYMKQAVQKFPEDERGYQLLASVLGELGQTAAQQATAAQLVVLLNKKLQTPGATDLENLTLSLAQAQLDSGDTAGGTATYQKAIQAYPADPTPRNNLAYAYAVRGTHLPEALTLADQAVALARKRANASEIEVATYLDTLGWVQYQQGRYLDAEPNLLEAANALPRLAEIRYHLGLVYIAEGNMAAARAELGHAVLLTQGYAAAQRALDTLPTEALPTKALPKSAVPKAAPVKGAAQKNTLS